MTWTRVAPALPEGLVSIGIVDPASGILWGTGETYAEGDWPEPLPPPTRLTSLDGLTWTVSTLPVLGIERLHPLPDGLYLTVDALPADGRDVEPPPAWMTQTSGVYRSVDQATWEPPLVGRQLGMEIIAVGDTLIMVGNDAKNRPAGWCSTDAGVTWQAARPGGGKGTMSSVAALPDGTLVAVGRVGINEPSTAAWVSPPVRP